MTQDVAFFRNVVRLCIGNPKLAVSFRPQVLFGFKITDGYAGYGLVSMLRSISSMLLIKKPP